MHFDISFPTNWSGSLWNSCIVTSYFKFINVFILGDTLFVGGCGRFFEGTPQQMHEALIEKLSKLPDNSVCISVSYILYLFC